MFIKEKAQTDKTLHFIGFGGAGCNALECIHNRGIKAKYTCITTPHRPNLSSDINFINFVPPPKSYFKDENESSFFSDMTQPLLLTKEIKNIFSENAKYILLAGLGGYTGTYMTVQIAEELEKQNKKFITICSLPFSFERQNNKSYTDNAKQTLQVFPDFYYFEMDMIREKYGNMLLGDALEKANEQFYLIYKTYTSGA